MKITELLGRRYKERPSEVKLKSHELLIRGGYIRPVASGIFSLLPPGLRVMRNIEKIIRSEMNAIGAQEIEMPLVQPRELWEESGRYQSIYNELIRFRDHSDHGFVLAMTHEEATVALARTEAGSYKDYPFSVYQFAKKFRDEARPRGGLIRVKEFEMKDAYSFHRTQSDLDLHYTQYGRAYDRIFARAGIPGVIAIKSDTGMMGGKVAHEYMLLCPDGEDTIITCDKCDYRANREVAVSSVVPENPDESEKTIEKIATPNAKTIDEVSAFLKMPAARSIKTVVYKPVGDDPRGIVVMIRGDREVNESKLSKVLRAMPEFADDAVFENTGMIPGYASGYKIKNARVIVDEMLLRERNMVTGANEHGFHLKNFNIARDLPDAEIVDVNAGADGDTCRECGGKIVVSRGIEVGNIFQLGEKYTRDMGMTYMDENGASQTPIMGCYGIGIGRLAASVIEANNDERGPIWSVSLAPWTVSLAVIFSKTEDGAIDTAAADLYKKMQSAGLDPIFDDRKISAGEKFADMDLLGVPLQFLISPKTIEQNSVEWKSRATGEKGLVKISDAIKFAQKWIADENAKIMKIADAK